MTDNFLRPYSLEHIIKLWVDECTGKFIDPITVTDAVITKHGKTLTEVLDLIFGNLRLNKDLLNDLKIRVEDLERYKDQFVTLKLEFDSLKYQINTGVFAKQSDLECLRNTLEALRQQLSNNNALFTQLLAYLMSLSSGQGGQGGTIDIGDLAGYLRTEDLLSAIDALNVFTKNIKSELTKETYSPVNGLTTLPPTIGASLFVGDTEASGERFYYLFSGDVDGDGYVTANDILVLYNILLNSDYTRAVNPDLDNDHHITSGDVVVVYNVLLNGREPKVHDRVTSKVINLPVGSVYMNNNRVYHVASETHSKLIGHIIDPNSEINILYTPASNGPLGNGGISAPDQTPEDLDDYDLTPQEKAQMIDDAMFNVGNKLINTFMTALGLFEETATLNDKIEQIGDKIETVKTDLQSGDFDYSAFDYPDIALNVEWEGFPQKYAQGLAFLKDFWDNNNLREIQVVQPLGSYKDFKRFLNNLSTNYIDISMFDSEGKYKQTLTRFNIVDVSTLSGDPFEGKEDTVIVAEYVPQSGTSYYFFWNCLSAKKPVIVEKAYFSDYLTAINYAG